MSKALAMARRNLNSRNPMICRTPSEILIMIASHLKTNADFITKATHVCHHWRATLLSCPDLWTYLNFARMSQAMSFLNRSKSFPIHVDLTNAFPSISSIELLCLHTVRIHTLKITRFDGLHELFHRPLASLKTLEVTTPDSLLSLQPVCPTAREFLTLTSLTVEHNPGALAFRSTMITHLRVAISQEYSEITKLPDLLRSCVFLEELEIESKRERSLRLPSNEAIPLPHLHSFTQTVCSHRHKAGILNNLYLPPSCSVVLRCIAGISNGHPPYDLPSLRDTSYFTNVNRLKVVYLDRYLGRKGGFTIDFINDRGTRFTAITDFHNYADRFPEVENPRARKLGLSARKVEVFCVGGDKYVTLKSYEFVTTLILSGPTVHLYLELLGKPKLGDACKSLHTLVLFVPLDPLTSVLVKLLLGVAQTRAKMGLPFRTVTFAYPSMLASDKLEALKGLEECVERVELLLGDDALDWDLDKYFLKGL
ncbi:hypothetical protein BDM02DRAFT_3118870 [Thelephora ganbajun]|uniref:Uncharacterized protein n=1 Tax=Thelephora ganbajun TaxID=370292 RepID=A0ACB6ZA62_THEGA|nr:hypothetical protein BDM02DRAFT_3118870 [Thelephora ganbajun]